METNILLESGTNELEVLEFVVGSNHYGINVAKVQEIRPFVKPTAIPNAHPCIEGIFMPRDVIITVIDLGRSLNLPPSDTESTDMYIITRFNQLNIGFHVNNVVGMSRVSWSDICKPDSSINNAGNGVATGIVKLTDKLIIILDFEKIVSDISPETGLKVSEIEQMTGRTRNTLPILIAEDSPMLSKLILDCLTKAGYSNIIKTMNGQEAWDKISSFKERGGDILNQIKLVITDIEMPQMDGHRLTKLIKDDPILRAIPVVIFSSLVNDEMKKKGESLGADAQLSKPEIGMLVEKIDSLLFGDVGKKNE